MRFATVVGLWALVTTAYALNYRVHGYFDDVKAHNIRGIESRRAEFLQYEQKIEKKISEKFSGDLTKFFVKEFEIHGEEVDRSSAIFEAYFSTSLNRPDIVEKVKGDNNFVLYLIEPVASLPTTPSTIEPEEEAIGSSITCANFGVPLPNNTCACTPFYFGDKCQNPNCQNGGIIDSNKCSCPPGVYSMNCESRGCLPGMQSTLDNTMQTFILVLNTRSTMAYVLNSLIVELSSLLPDMKTNANYIITIYLDSGNNKGFFAKTYLFTTLSPFLTFLNSVNVADGPNQQYTNMAIYQSLDKYPLMRGFSHVLVYTDAYDERATTADYRIASLNYDMLAIEQAIAWRARVSYFIPQQTGQPLNTDSNGYDAYRRVAQSTLGDIVSFDLSETGNVVYHLIDLYEQSEVIAVRYRSTKDETINFTSDYDTQFVTILLTVEPNGTLPTIDIGNVGSPDVVGARFLMARVLKSTTPSVKVSGGTTWNIRLFIRENRKSVLFGYSYDQDVDTGTSFYPTQINNYASGVAIPWAPDANITMSVLDSTYSQVVGHPIQGIPKTSDCTYLNTFGQQNYSQTPGPYGISVVINYNDGTSVTRIVPGLQMSMDVPTPIPYNCFNGGTVLTGPSCSCTASFTGPNCATPVCNYGGTVNPFPNNGTNLCLCPQGYSGNFCEQLACGNPPPVTFDNQNRTFSIIIQNTMSQAIFWQSIDAGVQALFQNLAGPDAFTQYVLTTFAVGNGKNYTTVVSNKYYKQSEFLYAMEQNNLMYSASSAQSQDVFAALLKAIRNTDYMKSAIVLFTDTKPTDNLEVNDIIYEAVVRQLEVNIIVTAPFNMSDCLNTTESNDYKQLAEGTGGVFIKLCNPTERTYTINPIQQFFMSYGTTHHHTETLAQFTRASCSDTITLDFILTNSMDPAYIVVNSDLTEFFSVILYDKDSGLNTTLQPQDNMPFLSTFAISPSFTNTQGYTAFITAGAGTNGTGECTATVSEKTSAAIFVAYSPNPSIDMGSASLMYGSALSPVLHLSNIDPGSNQVMFKIDDSTGSTLYTEYSLQRTSTCNYELYYQKPFSCGSRGDSYIITTTVNTTNGYIQRSQRGYCYLKNNACLNGGTMDADTNSCDCPMNYGGTLCEEPICQNSGSVYNSQCQCTDNYNGQFCQNQVCKTWDYMEQADTRQIDYVQITFVLEQIQTQSLVNVLLNSLISNLVEDAEKYGLPKMFTLVTFNDINVIPRISTTDKNLFITEFKNAINDVSAISKNATETKSMDALVKAYQMTIDPPAIIHLFTSLEVMPGRDMMAFFRQRIGTQVNLFYTPASDSPQVPSEGLFYLSKVARQSGGRVLPITKNSVSLLEPVMISMLSENAFVHDEAAQDCTQGNKFIFTMEELIQRVVIDVVGDNVRNPGAIVVKDGSGIALNYTTYFVDINAVILYIEPSNLIQPGTWSVTVKTTQTVSTSCYLQVRNLSPLRVITGFSPLSNDDFPSAEPYNEYANRSNPNAALTYMPFRLIDSLNDISYDNLMTLTMAKTDYYQTFTNYPVTNIAITRRDPNGCAYQFVTNQIQMPSGQGALKYIVQGTDKNNFQFQRTFFFNEASTTDDKETCVSGTRTYAGECQCDSQHNGQYCMQRNCLNGGSSSYGICVCPNGYYGQYCELALTA